MYQLVANGDVPDASYFNGIMKQTVIVCTSGTRPSSPNEGMTIYETDTDLMLVYTGSAWVDVATPAAWTSYTPAWTASTSNPSIGNGTLAGAYTTRGKIGFASIELVYNTTTNAGSGVYSFGLPPGWTISATSRVYGCSLARDQSAASHAVGVPTHASATTVDIRGHGINQYASSSPFSWGTGDFIRIQVIGEIA